jgi:hypothetical protein
MTTSWRRTGGLVGSDIVWDMQMRNGQTEANAVDASAVLRGCEAGSEPACPDSTRRRGFLPLSQETSASTSEGRSASAELSHCPVPTNRKLTLGPVMYTTKSDDTRPAVPQVVAGETTCRLALRPETDSGTCRADFVRAKSPCKWHAYISLHPILHARNSLQHRSEWSQLASTPPLELDSLSPSPRAPRSYATFSSGLVKMSATMSSVPVKVRAMVLVATCCLMK